MNKIFVFLLTTFFVVSSCTVDCELESSLDGCSNVTDVDANSNKAVECALAFVSKIDNSTRSGFRNFSIANVKPVMSKRAVTRSGILNDVKDSLLYVVNFADSNGYVIVAPFDTLAPVLAYVENGNLDDCEIDDVDYDMLVSGSVMDDGGPLNFRIPIEDERIDEAGGGVYMKNKFEVMKPLLVTKWGQNGFYRTYCPPYCPAGCVATALAQICSYLEFPKSYCDGDSVYVLDWERIKNYCLRPDIDGNLDSFSSDMDTTVIDQVAHFMWVMGKGYGAKYNKGGTEAYDLDAINYMRNEIGLDISGLRKFDASEIVADLKRGHRIVYMRADSRYYHVLFVVRKYVGGHAWVVDGYIDEVKYNKRNIYLHCNWGKEGKCNGYFRSDLLDTYRGFFNDEAESIHEDRGSGSHYRYNQYTATIIKH